MVGCASNVGALTAALFAFNCSYKSSQLSSQLAVMKFTAAVRCLLKASDDWQAIQLQFHFFFFSPTTLGAIIGSVSSSGAL